MWTLIEHCVFVAELLTVYTPADDNYRYENVYTTVQGLNVVKFRVKACEMAQIAVSQVCYYS